MFNQEEILKRLQNGESSEAIAKEMSDALNKAVKAKEEADADAEIQAQREQLKIDDMKDVLHAFGYYLAHHCDLPADFEEEFAKQIDNEEKVKELCNSMDQLSKLVNMVLKLDAELSKAKCNCGEGSECTCNNKKEASLFDLFNDFPFGDLF